MPVQPQDFCHTPEHSTRLAGDSDAGRLSERKAAVAAVRKSLGILPSHRLMDAAALTARSGFAAQEHGAGLTPCPSCRAVASGLNGWARTLGTLSQGSAGGQCREGFWRGCKVPQILHMSPQTPSVAWTELHNMLTCRINSIYFVARDNVRTYMVSCHCLGMNPSAPLALPAQARGTQTPAVEPACWVSGGSSRHRQEHQVQLVCRQELTIFLCLMRPRGTEQPIGFFLQFQQMSDRGGAGPSCTPAVQPGRALAPLFLAESSNAQPEATSILL